MSTANSTHTQDQPSLTVMRGRLGSGRSEPRRWYSVAEVAQLLGMAPMTVYRAIHDGEFPAVKIRGRYVIPARALDAMEEAALDSQGLVGDGDWAPGGPGGVVTVTALDTDVVLDEVARLALLVELTAERFACERVRGGRRPYLTELMAARLLEFAARWARAAADQERDRCATAYDGSGRLPTPTDLPQDTSEPGGIAEVER